MTEMNVTAVSLSTCMTANTAMPLYQYDYGQLLRIDGIELPFAYQVHFSTSETGGTSVTQVGNADGVQIPDNMLATGKTIYAFIYLHEGETDGETEYKITIPVIKRPAITDEVPTPAQQSAIDQAIEALNAGVDAAEGFADAAEESAQAAANSATAASGSASEAAQSAASAEASATAAQASASEAATSAQQADDFSTSAGLSAIHAEESAASALESADRAEQAAANAGYMFFHIDENGDLIYERTSNTQVNFYLSDGDLFVEAIA